MPIWITVVSMDLAYPLGKFDARQPVGPDARREHIATLAAAPGLLREAVAGLNDAQLDTPYRPGGWTVRQVVHHLPDSHINSYVRFRLALTEDQPAVKAYDEKTWAELPDARSAPPELSLDLFEHLHRRWVGLLEGLGDADFARTFRHSELGLVRLDTNLALYAWHSRHHIAHITGLRRRMGWK